MRFPPATHPWGLEGAAGGRVLVSVCGPRPYRTTCSILLATVCEAELFDRPGPSPLVIEVKTGAVAIGVVLLWRFKVKEPFIVLLGAIAGLLLH